MKTIKRLEIVLLFILLFISFIYPLLYSNELLTELFSMIGFQ